MSSGSDVATLCATLASASRVYSPEEDCDARRIAILLYDFLQHKKDHHVASNLNRPLLMSYQSDATSFLCRSEVNTPTAVGIIQRRGRVLEEFLCERSVLKTVEPGGSIKMTLRMRPPRPLSAGKKSW